MRHDSHGGSEQVAQAQAGDGGGPVDGGLVWEVEPPKLGEGEIRRERGPRREARAATWVWAPEQGRASVQGAGVAADMGDGAHTGGGPSQCKHCRRRETLLTGKGGTSMQWEGLCRAGHTANPWFSIQTGKQ